MGSPALKYPRPAIDLVLERLYSGPCREEEAPVAVGTTRVEGAARDPERVILVFINLGSTTIFLAPTQQVSTTRGIRLGSLGGLVAMDVWEDAVLPTLEWSAIGDLAGGTLYRVSVRRETIYPPREG